MKKFNSFFLTLLVLFLSLVAISCPNPTPEGYFVNTVALEGTSFESIRDADNEFVVRLNNATLKDELHQGNDVTDWISSPKIDGIKYQIKNISRDFREVTVRLIGEPTIAVSETELAIEIPARYFKENPGNVPVNTKKSTIKINENAVKLVASDTVLGGESGEEITRTEITLTLEGALFAPLEADANLQSWFSPVISGLEYKAKSSIPNEGANTLTIVVSGTPKTKKEGAFHISVEKKNLIVEKNLKSLFAQGELSYAIVKGETTASVAATVINGVVDSPINETFDVVLKKGQFNSSLLNTKVDSWIYKSDKTTPLVINGLSYTVTAISDDLHTATITISGTHAKGEGEIYPIEDEFTIIIPKSAIIDQDKDVEANTNGSHFHIQETPRPVAAFNEKLELYGAKDGEPFNVNGQINLNYAHFATSVAAQNDISDWFTLGEGNTAINTLGLSVTVTGVTNNSGEKEISTLIFNIQGVPTQTIDSQLNVTIKKEFYEPNSNDTALEKEDLTVNALSSFINVTEVTLEDTATAPSTLEGETGSAITDTFITVKLDDDHKFTSLDDIIGKENAISSWFYKKDGDNYAQFVIAGLKYTLSEVSGNSIKLKISGNAEKNTDVTSYPITDSIVVRVPKDYIEKNLKTVYAETKTSYNIGKSSVVSLDKEKISAFRNKPLNQVLTLTIDDGSFDVSKIQERSAEIPSWFTKDGSAYSGLTFALSGTPTASSFIISVSREAGDSSSDNSISIEKIDLTVPSFAIQGAIKDKNMKEAITYDLRDYPTVSFIAADDFHAAINAEANAQDYTIRLRNARFATTGSGVDVSTWFTTSRPTGLEYILKSVTNTPDGDVDNREKAYSEAVITIKGKPTATSTVVIRVSLPTSQIVYYDKDCNVAKNSVTIGSNNSYQIVDFSGAISTTANFGTNNIYGVLGKGFYNDATKQNEFEIPITLTNGGFNAIRTTESLLDWFKESPDSESSALSYAFNGITAHAKEDVSEGDSSLTIVLSGTPEKNNLSSLENELVLYIPKDSIQYKLDNLRIDSGTKYNIKEKSFTVRLTQNGQSTSRIDGYSGQAIEIVSGAITLSGAKFDHDKVQNSKAVDEWFTHDKRNSSDFLAKISDFKILVTDQSESNLEYATFTIGATPTDTFDSTLYLTIPSDHLLNEGFDIQSKLDNFKWNIQKAPSLSKDGPDNFIAAVGGESKENLYTISISDGLFMANAIQGLSNISTFFPNTVAGLEYKLKSISSDNTSIVVSISGVPTSIPDSSQNTIEFTIPKDYISPFGVSSHPGSYRSSTVTLGSYSITDPQAQLQENGQVVFGITRQAMADSNVTVLLSGGASFKALAKDTDVSQWFISSSGTTIDGLTYKIAENVADKSTTAKITISGTPTTVSSEVLNIVVPAGAITNELKNISVNVNGCHYGIGSAVASSSKVWAESNKDLHEDQDLSITLNNLEFDDSIASLDATTITSFFSYTKKGVTRSADDFSWLTHSFKSLSSDKKTLILSSSGTPEEGSEGGEYAMNITLPQSTIKNATMPIVVETDQNLIIQVVSKTPFTWELYDSASFAKRNITESDSVIFSENKSLTTLSDGSEITFENPDTALIATGTESEFSFTGLSRRGYKIAGLSTTIGGEVLYPASTFVHPNGSFYMFLDGDEVQQGSTQKYYVVWEPDTDMTVNGLKAWTPTDTSKNGSVLPSTFSLTGIKSLDDNVVTDKAKYTASDYLDYNMYNEVYLPVKDYNFAITGDDRGDYITRPTTDLKTSMMKEKMPNDFAIAEDVFTGYMLEALRIYNASLPENKRFELPTYDEYIGDDLSAPEYDQTTGVSNNTVSYGTAGTTLRDAIAVSPLDVSRPITYVVPSQIIVIANAMTSYYNAHTSGDKLTYAYATDYQPASDDDDTVVRTMKDAIELISTDNEKYANRFLNGDLTVHIGPAVLEATGFRLPTGKEFHVASSIIPKSDYDDDAAIYNAQKVWEGSGITYTYAGTLYPQEQLLNQASGARTPASSNDQTKEDFNEYLWYLDNANVDDDGYKSTPGFKKSIGTIKDKKPNNIALYGMNGNVLQWVDTPYGGILMKHSGGGALSNTIGNLVSSYVTSVTDSAATRKGLVDGFRLARTIIAP